MDETEEKVGFTPDANSDMVAQQFHKQQEEILGEEGLKMSGDDELRVNNNTQGEKINYDWDNINSEYMLEDKSAGSKNLDEKMARNFVS